MSGVGHEICRASAGTGKTYQLTGRYLRLLRGGADPGAILATTFTRKAAGEILSRVFGRLTQVASDETALAALSREIGSPLDRADCVAMLRRLVEAMPRLAIGTLDSFFNRIAQCFALELSVASGARLVDSRGPEAVRLQLEAIEAMLDGDDLATMLTLLRRAHHDAAARRVTDAVRSIVHDFHQAYLEAPDEARWTMPPVEGLLQPDELRREVEALTEFTCDWPTKNWATAFGKLVRAANVGDWKEIVAGGLGAKWPDGDYYRKPFPDELVRAMRPVMEHAIAVLYRDYAERTLAYRHLLRKFDDHYERLRREQGVMLFEDVTRRLARLLPGLGDEVMLDVYYRLDGRVRHLLLDEFQDTNPDQWAILQPIAEEVAGDESIDRSFYCVGDVKQAIYGWRGGCVELFSHVERNLGGEMRLTTMDLSQRSSQVILDAVNAVFGSLPTCAALAEHVEPARAWSGQFEPHRAAHTARAGYVLLETAPRGDEASKSEDEDEDEDEDEKEASADGFSRFVAERVAAIHQADRSRSIGVLVERRQTAARLLDELHRAGVEASGEGKSPIADLPAVAAVLSALTLADHPADTISAFHVVQSPVGEMLGLRGMEPGAIRATARRIRERLLDAGYARVMAQWMSGLAPSCDAAQLAGLEQLAGLAERYDPGATLRVSDFVRFVRGTDLERESGAAIRIMTIHGSKGLTFDATVLAELDKPMDLVSKLLIDRADPLSAARSVCVAPIKELRGRFAWMEAVAREQSRRELSEELCKLYVAMTRSRHGLYLFLKPMARGARKLTPGRIVLQGLTGLTQPPAESAVLYERGDPRWMARDRGPVVMPVSSESPPIRLKLPPGDVERSWPSVSPSGLRRGGRVTTAELLDVESDEGRRYGLRIHELLSRVGFVEEEGVEIPEELREILAKPAVRAVMERRGAVELWRERRFAVRDGDRLIRGTFDRVVFGAGGATILDFKTDTQVDVEAYRPQMQAYRAALSKLRGLEASAIGCKLVFVGRGEVVEV